MCLQWSDREYLLVVSWALTDSLHSTLQRSENCRHRAHHHYHHHHTPPLPTHYTTTWLSCYPQSSTWGVLHVKHQVIRSKNIFDISVVCNFPSLDRYKHGGRAGSSQWSGLAGPATITQCSGTGHTRPASLSVSSYTSLHLLTEW